MTRPDCNEADRKDLADAIAGSTVRLRNSTVGEWQLSEEAKAIIVAALQSETPAGGTAKVPEWMNSAPKDGTPILAFVPSYYQGKGGWVVVLWLGEKGMREAGWLDNRAWLVKPSCWLPLPSSPDGQEK